MMMELYDKVTDKCDIIITKLTVTSLVTIIYLFNIGNETNVVRHNYQLRALQFLNKLEVWVRYD